MTAEEHKKMMDEVLEKVRESERRVTRAYEQSRRIQRDEDVLEYRSTMVRACTILLVEDHCRADEALLGVARQFLRQEVEGFLEPNESTTEQTDDRREEGRTGGGS